MRIMKLLAKCRTGFIPNLQTFKNILDAYFKKNMAIEVNMYIRKNLWIKVQITS